MGAEGRVPRYPVLEEGSLAWRQGSYEVSVEIRPDHASATVSHRLSQAPFLERMLREGRARYACSVAIPITNYRRLHLADHEDQVVCWEDDLCGEPPLLRPMVIAVDEIRRVFEPEDGVSRVWQGRELTIPKGARLALGEYWGENSSLENLLEVVLDENMRPGTFKIEASDAQGFYFKAHTARDLHRFLFLKQRENQSQQQHSISTHMVSRCLEILVKDFGGSNNQDGDEDGQWQRYQNLKGLAGLLQRHKQPLWDDENFAADQVATAIYPHRVPSENSDDEDEDG